MVRLMLALFLTLLAAPAHAQSYGGGKAMALTGFGLGVGGELVTFAGQITLATGADLDTGEIDPDVARRALPIELAGATLNRSGGILMGLGTLRMFGANRAMGADYSNTSGVLGISFGVASLAGFTGAQILGRIPSEVGTDRALAGTMLQLGSAALMFVSFTFNWTQYAMNNANRPPERRAIQPAKLEWHLAPTTNGLAILGRF